MSETKHTPGPWEVFICDDGGEWTGWPLSINATNDPDKSVVRPGGQWPYAWDAAMSQREAIANARLIASAPDMLAALKEVREWIRNWDPNFTEDGEWPETSARVDAAISKAEAA